MRLCLFFLLVSLVSAQTTVRGTTTTKGSIVLGSGSLPLGPPNYYGSSTSVADLGTYSSPFSSATLYNTTVHSTLNPSTDCITRFMDQNIVQYGTATALDDNFSTGNLTSSGGNNDVMSNTDSTLIGIRANGGSTWIFKTSVSGGCLLNATNGGENPNLSFSGPFGFSRSDPTKLYHVTNANVLNQETINPSPTPMTSATTSNSQFPFDFTDCPGVAALVPHGTSGSSGSILGIMIGDTEFSTNISWTGGQGTAHFSMVYKPGTGCKTIDLGPTALISGTASIVGNVATVTVSTFPQLIPTYTGVISGASNANFNCANATFTAETSTTVSYTCSPALTNTSSTTLTTGTIVGNFGNIYNWCASSCGTVTAMAQETTCYDPNYLTGDGIHDSNITLDGSVVRIAGGCFNLVSGNRAFWDLNTNLVLGMGVGTSSWNPGTGYSFSGHPSDGVNHILLTNDPTPNIRVTSPLSTGGLSGFTALATLPSAATASGGFHGGWAHPTGDDTVLWTIESANDVGFSVPGQMTTTYLENEIFGVSPLDPVAPIRRFGPTYNSTTSGGFSCQDGIGFPTQDGKFAFFLSDGFANLGLDSQGNTMCSVFVVAMQ